MRTAAVIQARMGSERLPGKVLQDISGKPMIDRVVERVARCKSLDGVIVATSTNTADDVLASHCRDLGVPVVRGSENDVLSRYALAAEKYHCETIVRITSDCPLVDPEIIDQVVTEVTENPGVQYACNFFPQRLFPRGLDAEALTVRALQQINQQATDPRHREHVTLMIYENASRFNIASVSNRLDHSHLRWTVDTEADLMLVRKIYEHFAEQAVESFGYAETMRALTQNWHWCQINREVLQKAA
ncbi:cytidylyltransferase domain-containing protein [Mariniblastus fucicola]|uniref:3-deoxy-manno-octulosonate cytidylyltransferase n=1 Tax=Mariniblastus fucicola TaxID=980251 RepID=A0A5B9PDG1_9BACT|nr:glycosyltransferase family protein [Mariniblastus fucicola]QEG23499.1 3-deoxy-manno-octulosonate cytidylyltransferase [Mariniblastus fucicola]